MMPHPPQTSRRKLAALFFVTAVPMGIWSVPLSTVFTAHGRQHLVPWVLAASSIAAFISPLFVGALADQKMAPARLLRWLAILTGITLALTCTALHLHLNDAAVLIAAQVQALVAIPVWSVASSIVFSQLQDAKRQFGPLRAFATFGWMCGCWIVSFVLHSDETLLGGFVASGLWLVVALLTRLIPSIPPPESAQPRTWTQILGLDALSLLKNRDHRVVFITAALYCIPLAAFYPYTALQLRDLGVVHISAFMSIAQTTEILVMLLLAGLMARYRLKWVFLSGIVICVLRYAMNAADTLPWITFGTVLHGFAFTLYFITTQIYLEERIDPKWRVRAQALLTLLMGGVGNLLGYLGGGWWHSACKTNGITDWSRFWWGETALTATVCLFFALAYKGRGKHA
jgi:MFS family permease